MKKQIKSEIALAREASKSRGGRPAGSSDSAGDGTVVSSAPTLGHAGEKAKSTTSSDSETEDQKFGQDFWKSNKKAMLTVPTIRHYSDLAY